MINGRILKNGDYEATMHPTAYAQVVLGVRYADIVYHGKEITEALVGMGYKWEFPNA